jgi:hypothetical protein
LLTHLSFSLLIGLAMSLVLALFRHTSNLTRSFSRAHYQLSLHRLVTSFASTPFQIHFQFHKMVSLPLNFHPLGWRPLNFHLLDPIPVSQGGFATSQLSSIGLMTSLTSIPWTRFQSHKVVKYLTTLAPCKTYLPWSLLMMGWLPLNFHPLQNHLPTITCSHGLGISQLPPLWILTSHSHFRWMGSLPLSPTFTICGLTLGSMVWQFSHDCSPSVVAPRY